MICIYLTQLATSHKGIFPGILVLFLVKFFDIWYRESFYDVFVTFCDISYKVKSLTFHIVMTGTFADLVLIMHDDLF